MCLCWYIGISTTLQKEVVVGCPNVRCPVTVSQPEACPVLLSPVFLHDLERHSDSKGVLWAASLLDDPGLQRRPLQVASVRLAAGGRDELANAKALRHQETTEESILNGSSQPAHRRESLSEAVVELVVNLCRVELKLL